MQSFIERGSTVSSFHKLPLQKNKAPIKGPALFVRLSR
ncbi:hypothetical protein HMPREF9413_0674 [Paenibacillus sp. HGF7]|nr:hypothetical protein HMPREF9413_0674 [Paenibacillus sp. HGF7]